MNFNNKHKIIKAMKTLKKILLVGLFANLICILPQELTAQEKGFHYGVRFGLGESTLNLKNVTTQTSKLLISGGIATNYQFNRFLGANVDFLFTSKGGKISGVTKTTNIFGSEQSYNYNDTYNLYYAELPITGKLSVPLSEDFFVKVFAGPSFNFKLIATETREYNDKDFNNEYGYQNQKIETLETMEHSFIYGAGIDVTSKDNRIFFLDFRKNNSLNPIGTINNYSAKSEYFVISAGYVF